MNVIERLDFIQTKEDFVDFVRELLYDLRTNPNDWENTTLETYLEALSAWVEDSEGYYKNRGLPIPASTNWKMFGEIFLAAKSYE